MKIRVLKIFAMSAMVVACSFIAAYAQEQQQQQQGAPMRSSATEQPVALTSQPVALDSAGQAALAARLITTALNGAPEAPIKNIRLVIENRSASFYTYVSGWATFYDAANVRCGEGLFKVDAIAAGEAVETDLPGLRLKCAPTSWRIVATNLLTRAGDTAKPTETTTTQAADSQSMTVMPPLVISIDGQEHPIQLNNPITVRLGNRRRTITIRTAP